MVTVLPGHNAPSNYIKTIDYSLFGINGVNTKAAARPPSVFNAEAVKD